MSARLLTELIRTTNDLDYVERFQTLAKVNLEMRNKGPTSERLLRKAILEMDVGNYAAGLEAASDAIGLDEESPEAYYQSAVAHVLLAFVRAGALPLAPGMQELPKDAADVLLARAIGGFREAVRLNPGDEEAAEDLAALDRFVAEHTDVEALMAALRDHVL